MTAGRRRPVAVLARHRTPARSRRVCAGLLLSGLAAAATAGSCDRLWKRDPASTAGEEPGASPAAPAAEAQKPPPPPEATPTGPVTPKMQPPTEARVLSSAFSSVARALRPSVVRIDVEIQQQPHATQDGDDDGGGVPPFFRRFFQFGPGGAPDPGPQRGTGSGVVMNTSGDIVTNRHVVNGATTVKVTLIDGRELTAKTVGTDAETDVAVIRLEKPPADLIAARLGDSDKLEVGEWVLAVGSPLGLDQTVTAGIVSGLGRVGRRVQMSGGRVRHYIQTDAKINPGNSGGPLVNLSAEVVGINTLIDTGPGGAYGFAIPINQVRVVAQSLLKEGRVRYAYLGVVVGDVADLEPARRAELERAGKLPGGAFVNQVTPGGPAAKAGIQTGDVITDIDGHKIEGAGDVIETVSGRLIGTRAQVGVTRGGKRQVLPVTLGELPSQDAREKEAADDGAARVGLRLQTLTPELAPSLGLDPSTKGAVVAEVVPGSAAAQTGVREGDVILEIDRHAVTGADEASALLRSPRKGGHLVRLRGSAGTRFITLGGG
jgi:serine protease Do